MRPFEHVSGEYLIGQFPALKTLRYSDRQHVHHDTGTQGIDVIFEYLRYLDGGLEDLESICTRTKEALFSCLPVDDVPDVLHIRSFAIQVLSTVRTSDRKNETKTYLKVVGMLPHVNTKNWDLALANDRVLIFGCHDSKPLLLTSLDLDQPAPATALDAEQRSIERLLELVFVVPDCLDLLRKLWRSRALGFRRACWSEVLPKERVVDVAPRIELDALLESDLRCDVGCVHSLGLCLEGSVQVGDVSLVVLAMVQLHDLGGDVGFQRL